MRRKDREITDRVKIKEIISECDCCRLGFNDNGKVYIVPLNFGFVERNEKFIFYFHGAKTGRKHDIMKENNNVGFELDTNHRITKWQFNEKMVNSVCVFKLEVEELACKEHE